MRKNKLYIKSFAVLYLVILFFSFLCRPAAAEGSTDDRKNILLLNSYHPGLGWTEDETEGVRNTLDQCHDNLLVSIEYMDWKNYPTEDNLQHLYQYFKYKYQHKKIDLLIATDDAALSFALKNRESLFSDAPVVFCGVNQQGVSKITKGYRNFTGVLEEIDPTETIDMALKINPALRKVYVLFDNSESGVTTGQLVVDKIQSQYRDLETVPLNGLSYEELLKSAGNFDRDSILLITTYYSDRDGDIIEFERASREISKSSSVPVYHLYEMGLNNGAMGGSMLSGKLQGEDAASLALQVLKGAEPDNIPIVSEKTTRSVLDYQQLKRFGIPLERIPGKYEVINKPFSFFETYRTLVWSVLGVFVVLDVLIGALLFHIKKIKKMKEELHNSHEELTQIYEELTASDEELRQQFDELCAVQEKLSGSEERFRVAADGSNAVIWDVDLSTMQYFFSDMWYELLGYDRGEADEFRSGWAALIHPEDAPGADRMREDYLAGKRSCYDCEYRLRKKDGEYLWFNVRGKVLRDTNGNPTRFAGSFFDVTGRKQYETKLQDSYQELEATYEEQAATQEELKQQYEEILSSNERIKIAEEKHFYLAFHDSLTGLWNKMSLYDDLENTLLSGQELLAMLFVDLDNFKYVNDTMGHAFGDQLIILVSERLSSLLAEGCLIYRLSGDEFVVVMRQISAKEEAEMFASYIIAAFKEDFYIENSVIHVGISIGIATYPEHGRNANELLKNADIAMYKAKETGRNRCVTYSQAMEEAFAERATIEKYLYQALAKNEFEIHYQPQLDLMTNKITGLEALLRWNSPELGPVSPLKFIPVAEDTHMIIAIGEWVLKNACAFLSRLHQSGFTDLSVSVNISILQLIQADFNELVLDTLTLYDMEPGSLELEITETVLMESFETVASQLKVLRERGVRVALDDFGKGYSSLSYLRQLPITTIKIDKSFIDGVAVEKENENLTGHIITIGKSLGIYVIAEGVEKQQQLEFLKKRQCNGIQGYIFSKPVCEKEIERLLSL